MKRFTNKQLALSIMLASFLILSACSKSKKEENQTNDAIPVKIASIEEKVFAIPISTSGIVSSNKESKLSFKTGGIIAKVNVDEGDIVKAGQLLASLNMTEIDAQVSQAKENYAKIKRDFDRIEALHKENATTLEQFQNISTALQVAEQTLKIAKFNQSYSNIYASESGVVLKKLANEGEMIATGNPVFIIAANGSNDWVCKIAVQDFDWARIKLSDKAVVTLDAYPGLEFSASISEIGAIADPYSGTFPIELKINPQGKKLASGLLAKIEIKPNLVQKVKLVPIEALVESNGKNAFVYVFNNNQFSKIPVQIAFMNQNKVAIIANVEDGQQVITDGSAYITSNSKIELVK